MHLRAPSAFIQAWPPRAGWWLVFALTGCVTRPQAEAPSPKPAPAQAAARAQLPQAEPPQVQAPPATPPSPASVPGRVKLALVSSWLWLDGQHDAPLASVDYVRLFDRLLQRRQASAGGIEAGTLELEVDATSGGRILQDVLGLVEGAGYERVVLVTSGGSFRFCTGPCSAKDPEHERSAGRRTAVLLRQSVIALWSGKPVAEDAAGGVDPELEKLLELPRGVSDDELEAGVRRVCSRPGLCSEVDLYFEEALTGRELLRVVGLIERAARAAGTATPVVSISSSPPPAPGEEGLAFLMASASSGRLPFAVIRQTVRSSYGAFRACYQRGLMKNAKLEGRVAVRFVIQQDGSVDQIANGFSDLASTEVIDCVLHGFRSLRFPAPRGGNVTVEYPILLVTR